MIPKTPLEKQVVKLSAKLRPITEKQIAWGIDKCLDRYVHVSRNGHYCLECGHTWKDQPQLLTAIDQGCTCPNCGNELKLKQDYKPYFSQMEYMAVITTKADFQVIRMVTVKKYFKAGQPATHCGYEVMQYWISENGEVTIMSERVNGMSPAYDQWTGTGNMEVRVATSEKARLRHDLSPYKIYPGRTILPIIKRNGFNGHFYGFNPKHLFRLLLTDSRLETVLKAGQTSLVSYCGKKDETDILAKYWPSIKICIRNGYNIPDAGIWFDHLALLVEAGKDIKNPKFICPEKLVEEHNRVISKIKRLKTEADQKEYVKSKGKFIGLRFSDELINVKVLESVEEFEQEGAKLSHCVFRNEYFKKANSLVLSARIKDEPVETIEVYISNMKISQCHGLMNQKSPYHDRIINLVQNNIPKIAKIAHQTATV